MTKTAKHPTKRRVTPEPEIANAKENVTWHKFSVVLPNISDLVAAMPVALSLRQFSIGLYFARYTSPKPTIEFQVWSRNNPERLVEVILNVLRTCKVRVKRSAITFKPCNGSAVHAMAFKMAVKMEEMDLNHLQMVNDVTHWLANMLGFSYAQEGMAALGKAHMDFGNCLAIQGAINGRPIFPNPVVLARGKQSLDKLGRDDVSVERPNSNPRKRRR